MHDRLDNKCLDVLQRCKEERGKGEIGLGSKMVGSERQEWKVGGGEGDGGEEMGSWREARRQC